VAHIKAMGGQLGSVRATLGAGKYICMLCLALTTASIAGHLVDVAASSGGRNGTASP
jgi:hypothetical protein